MKTNKTTRITITYDVSADSLIHQLMQSVKAMYPHQLSFYIRTAITYFEKTGSFLKMGGFIPKQSHENEKIKDSATIFLEKEQIKFLESKVGMEQKGHKRGALLKYILKQSIEVIDETQSPYLMSLDELTNIMLTIKTARKSEIPQRGSQITASETSQVRIPVPARPKEEHVPPTEEVAEPVKAACENKEKDQRTKVIPVLETRTSVEENTYKPMNNTEKALEENSEASLPLDEMNNLNIFGE